MTEAEFLELYKKKRKLKNIKEAKEKLELFWDVIFTGIALEKKSNSKRFWNIRSKETQTKKDI